LAVNLSWVFDGCSPAHDFIVPLLHGLLLQRNLVYTGITRGKKLVVVVGQRRALGMAVKNNRTEQRFSGLLARLKSEE
jgi:exodeoxyribonuclease V alpha subunit